MQLNCRNLLVLFLLLSCFGVARAGAEERVIFLVRHAERADAGGKPEKDPALSVTGRERAEALARILRDAGIRAIYTTEYRRTRETAAPLAKSLGVSPTVIAAGETATLVKTLQSGAGNSLVVAHSNTLPEIVHALGVQTPLTFGEKQYDDLFLLLLAPAPQLLHLHYPR